MKKYLLSLLVFFSASLGISFNAGALSYPYTAFPIHSYYYLTEVITDSTNGQPQRFGVNFDAYFLSEQENETGFLRAPSGTFIPYRWNNSTLACEQRSDQNIFRVYDNHFLTFDSLVSGNGLFYYYFDLPNSSNYNDYRASFENSRRWQCYHKNWYDYDSIYSTSYDDLSSTPYIKSSVDLANQFISSDEGLYSLKTLLINLPIDTDNIDLPAGTDLKWQFRMFTYDVFSDGFTNVDENPVANLHLSYFHNLSDYTGTYNSFPYTDPTYFTSDTISCSVSANNQILVVHSDLTFNTAYSYDVDCSYHLDYDVDYIFPYLGLSSNSKLFTFDIRDGLMFGSSSLITNNEEAPSGKSANPEPTGTSLNHAPGWSDLHNGNTGDYNDDLTNLFKFDVLNPFGSIYDLFTSHQNCVDISTLASMIHSSQTVYCSWWPSSVVNIVTPVFALASTMLLFGFFVSWLRSDAGDASIDNGGTSIKVKGSKK